MSDAPYLTYVALYILSFQIIYSNSRTSTLWKLNIEEGKIVESSHFHHNHRIVGLGGVSDNENDQIFDIITSTIHRGKTWSKHDVNNYCSDCPTINLAGKNLVEGTNLTNKVASGWNSKVKLQEISNQVGTDTDEHLDCGKPVNFTYYDNLVGVANRHSHPHVPEPQVTMIFKKRSTKGTEFDVSILEKKLKKAKREKPKSVQLYNQIGNFWRLKGDAQKSIECFRRALAVSPHNAEVLLNLARVLFNLQYLDDAIYLTRRSLEVQPPDKNAWLQYFTLGEIFKAYGHYQEATLHFRHTLELKPDFHPAAAALKDMESLPDTTIHIYTLLIIICLVLGVLLVILSSVEGTLEVELEEELNEARSKHLNRIAAMRSLRMGLSSRQLRVNKRHYGTSGSASG